MRPLNRPMFKYGGPIKEGIMDGMREPKKNGKIVGGKQSPLLAGAHPLKDAEGREQHFIPALYALGLGALRAAPMIYRGFRMAGTKPVGSTFRNLFPTARFRTLKTPGKDPSPAYIKGDPTAFAGSAGTTKTLGFREALKDPVLIGKALRENPFTAATLGIGAAGQIKNIPDIVSGGVGLAADTGLGIANYLLGTDFSRNKKDDDIKTTEEGPGIKRGGTNVGDTSVTGTTKPGTKGGSTVKSDAEKQQINEARIKDTKEKYYKLMGIDKMNKDAVYDSLIDASKIVSEEGADLKGSIRSGNLQNRIIQAISANLDKSADLKKQIDAAVLKGEIEKDIKASDPDAALDKEYKRTQIALGKKKLEGPSAADVMSSATIDGKNIVTSNTLTQVLSGMGRDVDFTFPDDKYQKWEKNNQGKDEIDYLTENYGSLDDGLYVVNKKAFEIKDGNVFKVDLDKVTG